MFLEYTDILRFFPTKKRLLWEFAEPFSHWMIVPCLEPNGRYTPHCYDPSGDYCFLWDLEPDYASPDAVIAAAKTAIQVLHLEILLDI